MHNTHAVVPNAWQLIIAELGYYTAHLVYELSVYPSYGVPSVPVQLLWAGGLQLLPHALQIATGPTQAGRGKQVVLGRAPGKVVLGAPAD